MELAMRLKSIVVGKILLWTITWKLAMSAISSFLMELKFHLKFPLSELQMMHIVEGLMVSL